MTYRDEISWQDANDFARSAFKVDGPCGSLEELLEKRERLIPARSVLRDLLWTDWPPLTKADTNRQQAIDGLADAFRATWAAWKRLQPLLTPQSRIVYTADLDDSGVEREHEDLLDSPHPGPVGAHIETLERWQVFEDAINTAGIELFGYTNSDDDLGDALVDDLNDGLVNRHRGILSARRSQHPEDGRPRGALHRPVAGWLYIALGGILEHLIPGPSPAAVGKRADYRWPILFKAVNRFPDLVNVGKESEYARPDKRIKDIKNAIRKQSEENLKTGGESIDFLALCGWIRLFPPLFPRLLEADRNATLHSLSNLRPYVALLKSWGENPPPEEEQSRAILKALEEDSKVRVGDRTPGAGVHLGGEIDFREIEANRYVPHAPSPGAEGTSPPPDVSPAV